MPRGFPWTQEDLAVLAEVYPHCGAQGVHELLPRRSLDSITNRASIEKVRRLPVEQRKTLPQLRSPEPVAEPVPAAWAPNLTPVPNSALNLPWSRRPRDPQTCRSLAAVFEHLAESEPVKRLGEEAVASVRAEASILRTMAERIEREQAAA